MADQVLYFGVACITDLVVKEGLINLDFADVRAVMREMGKAMMGTGEASGDKRALRSAEAAISNPLIDDVSMRGARGLLISITGGKDLTLYEVDEAATRIREEVDPDANIIVGATFDESLDGIIRVSVVATGVDISSANTVRPAVSLHAPVPLAHQLEADHVRIAEPAKMSEAQVLRSAPVAAGTKVFIPPPPAQRAIHSPQHPSIEEFPFLGREFRTRRDELAEEDHPEKRRLSLLQRLAASVWEGVRTSNSRSSRKHPKYDRQSRRSSSSAIYGIGDMPVNEACGHHRA